MTMITNTQENVFGVSNHASGVIVSDATTAAGETITLGFAPRMIRFNNLTDRISDEWYLGLQEAKLQTGIRALTAKLDADAGVTDTNYAALWNPASSSLAVLRASIQGIALKLDADGGVTDTTYYSLWNPSAPTESVLRASFNGILAKLDADAGVTDTNYSATLILTANASLHTVANGTRTNDVTNGIEVVGNTFVLTATTMVASKTFCWEALG
jgi:hypothetical protein